MAAEEASAFEDYASEEQADTWDTEEAVEGDSPSSAAVAAPAVEK